MSPPSPPSLRPSLSLSVPPPPSQVLSDATEKVKEKSCYALEAFCENLGDYFAANRPRSRLPSASATRPHAVSVTIDTKLCFNS